MNSKAWLAASIAMGLTVGFGARFLTADEAVSLTALPSAGSVVAKMTDPADSPWMHPGITVVMQVPAKADEGTLPAGQALSSGDGSAAEQATEGPWMHPGITVVVRVPAKSDEAFVLARSTGETLSPSEEPMVDAAAEGIWMHPAITVVVKVPARADRSFAMGESTSAASRPTVVRPWRAGDGNPGFPAIRFRDQGRFDDRDFDRVRGRNWRPWTGRPQVEAGAVQGASNA